ncbi:MAG: hypothetical protein F9K45_02560 [Melioribacteraceae bacterium]|nr:MAG: hypothetical protein F9K45_02560 [Melioribacteraceae bacterium]
MKNQIIKILPLLVLFSLPLFAQTEQADTSTVQTNDSLFVMQKSPWGAVLRSAIVPGWGQFYNESYWKIPIVVGLIGYYTYGYIHNNDLYIEYRDKYSESLKQSALGNSNYKKIREFYKDQRDLFAVYFGLTYFLNLVDAYVDAHLFDFDVSENPYTHTPQINMKFFLP